MIFYIAVLFFIAVFGIIIYFVVTRDEAEKEIEEREHHHHEHRGYCTIDPKPTKNYEKLFAEDTTQKES